MEERLVRFRPRAILIVLGIILAGVVLIEIVQAARGVLIWIFVALFLALALNPAVDWLLAHGVKRRGTAVAITMVGAILLIAAVAATIVPTIVAQVNDFVDAVPDYVEDLSAGEGPAWLPRARVRDHEPRPRGALGGRRVGGARPSGTALAVTKGVVTAVIATVTIAFLTLFMLLEGPPGWSGSTACSPRRSSRAGVLIGRDIYRTIGGYVTGNLAISVDRGHRLDRSCSWPWTCRTRSRWGCSSRSST